MKTSVALIAVCLVGVYHSCSAASIVEEIYNGQRAVKGQFPFDVLIEGYSLQGKQFFCGGSLISDTWVLSAGHCADNTNYTIISAGFVSRDDMAEAQNFTVTQENIHVHPDFEPRSLRNDVSLMKLPTPVQTSDYVSTINLPPKSDDKKNSYVNSYATSSGWGTTSDAETTVHSDLMFKKIKIVNNAVCKQVPAYYSVNDKMLCTDRSTNGGPCPGDSGTPLVINGTDGKPVTIGIGSAGFPCQSGNPVLYVKVASFLDWISSVTGVPVK